MKTRFRNGQFLTSPSEGEFFRGDMIVEDGVITSFQSMDKFNHNEQSLCDKEVDLEGKLVLPGFVNTHGHLGGSLLRGVGDDLPLKEWLETKMWPNEARLTQEDIQLGAKVAIAEMIKSGTTTFVDMYHLHMHDVCGIVEKTGIRAALGRGMIGLCSKEEQEMKLQAAIELYERWHKKDDDRIRILLMPHSPYTCPPEFLKRIVEEARKRGIMLHTHLSETRAEVTEHVEKYGQTPAMHLDELGFFEQPTLAAHGVHLTDSEQQLLADRQVSLSHNPVSNAKLGSGIAPIRKLMDAGVIVSLGTDSVASNNNLDMLEELRFANLLQKAYHEKATELTAGEALAMATENGGKALQWNVGRLQPGMKADFITMSTNTTRHAPAFSERLISHIVYSSQSADILDTYVAGEPLMRDRKLLTIDEEAVLKAIHAMKEKTPD
ncbi:amidohydrolase [Texcoconibacillus texcoconensis]|uniref:5-methylthioadenosine/S-adenosylhomocysteine deaminase n=1 Tax=Texcoconibacillus texcoconensis TaxID=1095777 RepID=A0A840QQD5_9BACI|nr:amidohydrolase [Texcoconibacillus texcoconensis]MBB5173584.1 5-methylthioadenosine/S-adenosylhomocysteine deaminase [Texcoconibacillus texcoconensis]